MAKKAIIITALICILASACSVNSVTKQQLEQVKAGDVLVYRFQKDGKTWFYADKITRIESDKVFYNPGKMEATAGNDDRLKEFVTDKESTISKAELLKYDTEQGDDRKVIIWIR
jgi:uracil phosphoribosyltransferase